MKGKNTGDPGAPGRRRFTTAAGETETVAEAVVRSAAAVAGREPTELEPLGYVVDVDGLEALFGGASEVRLSFSYAGCRVTVRGRGEVSVRIDDERLYAR